MAIHFSLSGFCLSGNPKLFKRCEYLHPSSLPINNRSSFSLDNSILLLYYLSILFSDTFFEYLLFEALFYLADLNHFSLKPFFH